MIDTVKLYHVTKADKVPSIMEKGLVPMIGWNSRSAGDDEKERIYLADYRSALSWNIIFGGENAILEVDVPRDIFDMMDVERREYNPYYDSIGGMYAEMALRCPIPPRCISVHREELRYTREFIYGFMALFLDVATGVCIEWAQLCMRKRVKTPFSSEVSTDKLLTAEEELDEYVERLARDFGRFDMSIVTEDIAVWLIEEHHRRGNRCFTDKISGTDVRLYDALTVQWSEPRLRRHLFEKYEAANRTALYECLHKYFGSALLADTGNCKIG